MALVPEQTAPYAGTLLERDQIIFHPAASEELKPIWSCGAVTKERRVVNMVGQ